MIGYTILRAEAEKRGLIDLDKISFEDPDGDIYVKGYFAGIDKTKIVHEMLAPNYECLSIDGVIIFNSGVWARVIKGSISFAIPRNDEPKRFRI